MPDNANARKKTGRVWKRETSKIRPFKKGVRQPDLAQASTLSPNPSLKGFSSSVARPMATAQ
jgi:hypothetical protein